MSVVTPIGGEIHRRAWAVTGARPGIDSLPLSNGANALTASTLRSRWRAASGGTPFLPVWSRPAALRALRATLVIPGLFAITDKAIGNPQMATFAAFGGFATLVLASFGGTRRDKLVAHFGLAVAGSVLLTIGTAVNSSVAIAAVVTVPVTFAVFFAGIGGPNAAAGVTGALLAYVLPAASPGMMSMVPDRLAGWWLASVAGTVAVLTLSPPSPGDALRRAARDLATALANGIDAMLRGGGSEDELATCIDAKQTLLSNFNTTVIAPTGLSTADQALANGVELLEWCAALFTDAVHERSDASGADPADRALLAASADVLRDVSSLLGGADTRPDLDHLEERRRESIMRLHGLPRGRDDYAKQARLAFHAQALAVTALVIGANGLLARGLVDADWVAEARIRWFGGATLGPGGTRRLAGLAKYSGIARRHASVRSVWFVNSLRGSLALALAVLVADLTGVQHGFWVVFGTLSVLRTNASTTGSTAFRALIGTAVGFLVGAALIVAIGTDTTALWVALPIAVAVAAYAPGTAPFAVGQAAFTVLVAVLFNLLVPVGWRVGVVRIEDVALGCAVSLVVGTLFWPRGVASVVGDDLADAYRIGASYLRHAVDWVAGLRADGPMDATAAVTAGLRLDDALRAFSAEQGTKHMKPEELWRLVGGSLRLRLTAHAVAGMPPDNADDLGTARDVITYRTEALDEWYGELATEVGRPSRQGEPVLPPPPAFADTSSMEESTHSRHAIWLCEHLDHLSEHLCELVEPATHLAKARRRPWWR